MTNYHDKTSAYEFAIKEIANVTVTSLEPLIGKIQIILQKSSKFVWKRLIPTKRQHPQRLVNFIAAPGTRLAIILLHVF
jgi:hypothetical protein